MRREKEGLLSSCLKPILRPPTEVLRSNIFVAAVVRYDSPKFRPTHTSSRRLQISCCASAQRQLRYLPYPQLTVYSSTVRATVPYIVLRISRGKSAMQRPQRTLRGEPTKPRVAPAHLCLQLPANSTQCAQLPPDS